MHSKLYNIIIIKSLKIHLLYFLKNIILNWLISNLIFFVLKNWLKKSILYLKKNFENGK